MGSMTAAGTTLAICANTPATNDAAGYAALTFVTIGGVEKIGAIGASYENIKFTPLAGPVESHKGPPNYGSLQPSLALDDSDAGQTLLRTAADDESSKIYSVEVTYPDGAKRYSGGRVFGFPETVDGAGAILMANPVVELVKKVIKVAAPVIP